jgi:hypothetical protein
MAAEEDKKFDAVLGGFLVNDLRVRAEHLHCPESDVLAAYHERSLLPEEMNSWKEHIVGCARCQAILAEVQATDSIPLQAAETAERQQEVLVADAAKPLAAASKGRSVAPASVPEKSRVTRLSRGVRWQWLAPAGALAAGLLVWVAWHENQPLQVKAPAEVKMAKAEPPSTPAPTATRQPPESTSSDRLTSFSKGQGAISGAVPAKKLSEENLKQLERLDSSRSVVSPKSSTGKESGARQDAEREYSIAADRVQSQPTLDAKTVVGGAAGQEVAQVQTQAANAQGQNQLNKQKIPGPSPLGQAEQAKKSKSESPALAYRVAPAPAPAPAAPAAFDHNEPASKMIAAFSSPHVISAPGRRILWRAGHAGLIEFSSDGGSSWSPQTSNVLVDLTSGSAPSDKVCWIVGRAGTILLTTDAGLHWSILHSPFDEDLGGVRATDALHATIWNSLNTKTFETTDGGITWKPVASQ